MTEKSEYKNLREYHKANPEAYGVLKRIGRLDEFCKIFGWFRKLPNGYWTLERCKEDALKYNSKTEWQNNSTAYTYALKNGWREECCAHMKNRKPNGYWTLERCKEDALKYNSKMEWRKNSTGCDEATRNRWMEECCSHMELNKKWTLETCKEEALTHNTRGDWKKSGLGYDAAIKNGWYEECCKHMERVFKPIGYWTLENCKEDALKYSTRLEWKKNHSHVYQIARKNGWLEECCASMKSIKPKNYWTFERCKEDALKYNTKTEWKKNSPGCNAAFINGWYEECCKHMISGYAKRYAKRKVKI